VPSHASARVRIARLKQERDARSTVHFATTSYVQITKPLDPKSSHFLPIHYHHQHTENSIVVKINIKDPSQIICAVGTH
jgi:hypothetical protein